MTTVREALELVLAGRSLNEAQITSVFDDILDEGAPGYLVAGLLVALADEGRGAAGIGGRRAGAAGACS